jgi:hypothetical protein
MKYHPFKGGTPVLKRGDKGPEVVKLQKTIQELGYSLPRWGADGDLGTETLGALALLLQAHGKHFDDDDNTVTAKELEFVYKLASKEESLPEVDQFFDLREESDKKYIMGRRSWKDVTGICLHQTACVLGEKPSRWATIGAHNGVTRGGKVIWMHDHDLVIVHGNGWNAQTVGIELDGTYAGVEGDIRTFWRPADEPNLQPQSPTEALVKSAQATIRWIVDEVARHGGKIKVLVAHRQASKDRQSDPGSAIWQQVALPLHKELGLTDGGVGFKIGSGYPIPESWDPRCKNQKY